MPLKEFTKVRAKARDREPRLGVQKNGRISLNIGAMEALNQPTHVVLLFDEETLELGVRAADPGEQHSYSLRGDKNRSTAGATVSAVALFSYFELDSNRFLGSYPANNEDGVLIIQLRQHADVE